MVRSGVDTNVNSEGLDVTIDLETDIVLVVFIGEAVTEVCIPSGLEVGSVSSGLGEAVVSESVVSDTKTVTLVVVVSRDTNACVVPLGLVAGMVSGACVTAVVKDAELVFFVVYLGAHVALFSVVTPPMEAVKAKHFNIYYNPNIKIDTLS